VQDATRSHHVKRDADYRRLRAVYCTVHSSTMSVTAWTVSIEDRERLIQAAISGAPTTSLALDLRLPECICSQGARLQPILEIPRRRRAPHSGWADYLRRKRRERILRYVRTRTRRLIPRAHRDWILAGGTICAERTALVKAVVRLRTPLLRYHADDATVRRHALVYCACGH
jgi:hypothetical protein